jgi:type IV pilus assembly protein PilX
MNKHSQRYQGFALITALLLLVGLMLLGVSAMNMSILDERIAGNVANRNTTYQLAETALRQAEQDVENLLALDYITPPNSWYTARRPTAAAASGWAEATDWSNARTVVVPGAQSSQQVQYLIEDLDDIVKSGDGTFRYLRITARASDANNSSSVVLQSIIRRIRIDSLPS